MPRPTALITGVHTGLGLELAALLLERGRRVLGLSRRAPESLAGRGDFRFEAVDLSRFESIGPALDRLLHGVDELELAVLNAGVLGEIKDLRDFTVEEARAVMDVNVWANKVLVDELMRRGLPVRQVVGISSGASVNGSGGWGPYNVSKAAFNLLLRTYADEHPSVHFTALAPGVLHTGMIDYILSRPANERHPANERIRSIVGTPKLQTPRAAAKAVLEALPKLRELPSGSFADLRSLG